MSAAQEKNKDILLELRGIRKEYQTGKVSFEALKDVDLSLPRTGFVVILGPSGSGKTTLLNIIGGLDHFQEGDLLIDGVSTKDFSPSDWDSYRNKHIGFVFQSYNLVSSYSLEKNVTLPLSLNGTKREERIAKAKAALEKVGLNENLKKKPGELSGGQQQRVAIARAIINDPSVILCDEPTGALDSKSSVTILELLKELSKDRLVLVVTHNEVLAQKYADRIIVVEDGKIASDSNMLEATGEAPKENKGLGKSKMPIWSAFATSFQNIFLKKGRNIVTAIACSIGVIGVCLVLGASNGFRTYVNNVETSVGSSVPITISPTTYSSRSNNKDNYNSLNEFPDDGKLRVYDTSYSSYVSHQNVFSREYLNYLNAIVEDPKCPAYGTAMSILENRKGLDFHFYTENGDTGKVIYINASRNAGTIGSMLSSYASIPGTIIHELYGDENLLDHYYKVIEGRMPEKEDELVLVVDRFNRVEFSTLRYLGILSESSYAELSDEKKAFSFSDILYSGPEDTKFKEYKCYRNSDFYDLENPFLQYREQWSDVYLEGTINNGVPDTSTLKFVGTHDESNPKEIKVFRGPNDIEAFYHEDHNAFNCKIVGVLRPTEESYLTLMPSSLCYTKALKDEMTKDYETKSKILADTQKSNWLIPYSYKDDGNGNMVPTSNDGLRIMNEALANLETAFKDGNLDIQSLVSTSSFMLLGGAMQYISATTTNYDGSSYSYSYTTDAGTFLNWNRLYGGEFKNIRINSFNDLLTYYFYPDFFSSKGEVNIIDILAYMNAYSLISSISIFPSSLTAKVGLKEYLDAWNKDKSDADAIVYSDVVSEVTDTIGVLITVISAALVIFASVSLVVSSIMTSIVSYVSVIERKKEIGVLRSVGARKTDVGRLFESENAILGFFSGVLGVLVALIISIPVNFLINDLYPQANLRTIISVNPLHAVILVASAVLLALISGFIPSRIAARKDPVECLRSE